MGGEVDLGEIGRGVDRGMAKIDRERQREAVMRFEAGPFLVAAFTLADFDGLEHADELLGRVLFDDAGRAQR